MKIIVRAEVDQAIAKLTQLDSVNKNNHKTGLDLAKSIAGYTTGYGLAVRAAQSVISTTSQLVTTSLKLAAAQERVKMEFSVLTGSMATGNALFDRMNKLAAQTPLEFMDIAAAGKQLLSVGVPVGQITDKLRMLGDVAMGNPEKLDRLTMAFGQLRSKGVASMEQLNRFIEAGVPIMKELEKQTGMTGDEVFKLVSAGKVGFKDVELALKNMTSEGGLYHDMMKKVAETAEGKFSTAMDNAKMALAEVGKEALPIVTGILDAFNKAMDARAKNKTFANIMQGEVASLDELKSALQGVEAQYAKDSKVKQGRFETDAMIKSYTLDKMYLEERIEQEGRFQAIIKATEKAKLEAENKAKKENEARIARAEEAAIAAEKEGQIVQYWNDVEHTSQIKAAEAARKAIEEADEQVLAQQRIGESVKVTAEAVELEAMAWGDWTIKIGEFHTSIDSVGESMGLVFEDFGAALVEGENGWKIFGQAGLNAISAVVEAYGKMFVVKAAGDLALMNFAGAAMNTAAAAGAFTAAGAIKAIPMAEGGSGIVTKPTLFLAGEAGPEPFAFGGANNKRGMGMGGNTYNTVVQNIGGSVIAERQVKSLAMSGMAQAARGY